MPIVGERGEGDGTRTPSVFVRSTLVVWEGCDIFGTRRDGPCLEVKSARHPSGSHSIPVILNYEVDTNHNFIVKDKGD